MSDTSAVDVAAARLLRALELLEAAVERRREADQAVGTVQQQLHVLGNDRARLAAELDAATARVRRLEEANRAVAKRLDQAMDSLRSLMREPRSERLPRP